jgi:hypothetical protein
LPSKATPMGREKSWLWQHFHQGSAKVDKVHWQACCKYCVKVKVKELENADQQAVRHGILQAARTSAILTQEGKPLLQQLQLVRFVDVKCILSCAAAYFTVIDSRLISNHSPLLSMSHNAQIHAVTKSCSSLESSTAPT